MIKSTLVNGRLSDQEIVDYIRYNDSYIKPRYEKLERYFRGINTAILNQADKESGMPDNKIPVPFARKIGMAVKNYLFSRDAVYSSEDKEYMNQINDVFYVNDNYTKTAWVGEDLIVQGISYKIFYMDQLEGKMFPRYTVIDQSEGIPVYSMDIEPSLIAFIRRYSTLDVITREIKYYVEVYYSDVVQKYNMFGSALSGMTESKHDFKQVPVVVYGYDDMLGTFEPVIHLIDAIDTILSSDMNEIQRFELLYLVLIGDKLPDDPAEVQKMVQRRIFELSENAQMSFLEKHIDSEFNMSLLKQIIELTHSISGVPDFASPDFAADSGIALQYKLIGFEQVASEIEAVFIKGEMESIDLINSILFPGQGIIKSMFNRFVFWKANQDKKIKIELMRNLPEDVKAKLEEAEIMQRLNVSQETILDYLPMIDDVQEELKRAETQEKKSLDAFMARQQPQEPRLPMEDNNEEDNNIDVVQ